jgi:hypothetical protein
MILALLLIGAFWSGGTAAEQKFAPESIGGVILELTTDETSGWCSNISGHNYLLLHGVSGDYTDEDASGQMSDQGTYEYTRFNNTDSRIIYHVSQGGTWEGGDYTNYLHWTSPDGGTYHGQQTSGNCVYGGKFFVRH